MQKSKFHAIVLSEFGRADCLLPADVDYPAVNAGCAIVQLEACALNWHDVLVREGRCGSPIPHILGADGAGVRMDTGEEVMIVPAIGWGELESAPSESWEILGDRRPGTYAEVVHVPVECLVPKPPSWSWGEAAAFSLVGLTSYRALFTRGRLRHDESLLVLGAGGGLATMAVILGSAIGADVIVTSSSETKIARAQGLGARDGVVYTNPIWVDAARALSPSGNGFDLVLDGVGLWADALKTLRPGGRLVVLGASRSSQAHFDIRPFYHGQYDLIGSTMGSPRDFTGLQTLMKSYDVRPPVIDRIFALDDAAEAHEYLESGRAFGKVVLDISGAGATKS